MIRDPFAILAVLLLIEGAILFAAQAPRLRRLFRIVPFMFWIYFLPMLVGTFGLLPPETDSAGVPVTPLYGGIVKYCLPACLILLMLHVDLGAIFRLGPLALAVMVAGALGVMVGGPIVAMIFGSHLPPEMWKGFGALSGSWTGGSTNLIAVSRGIDAPRSVEGIMIIVDTIVVYCWMAILMLMARRQEAFDRWNRSRVSLIEELRRRAQADGLRKSQPITLGPVGAMAALAVVGTAGAEWAGEIAADWIGSALPQVKDLISGFTCTIIIASTLGILLSLTPVRRLGRYGTSSVGYLLLYLVLASIGAMTNLNQLHAAKVMILAGVVWVLIHGVFILVAGRLLRVPLALIATASQANLGGVASAPVVAEVYQEGLAPVALLLAVLGNISGTYLGITCAARCRAVWP